MWKNSNVHQTIYGYFICLLNARKRHPQLVAIIFCFPQIVINISVTYAYSVYRVRQINWPPRTISKQVINRCDWQGKLSPLNYILRSNSTKSTCQKRQKCFERMNSSGNPAYSLRIDWASASLIRKCTRFLSVCNLASNIAIFIHRFLICLIFRHFLKISSFATISIFIRLIKKKYGSGTKSTYYCISLSQWKWCQQEPNGVIMTKIGLFLFRPRMEWSYASYILR